MIPYFELHTWQIGPITVYIWGLFVAVGIIVAIIVSRWYAKRMELDPKVISELAGFTLISAIIGARVFHVLFYEPLTYLVEPLAIVKVWEGGMSMFGGLFFAGATIILLLKRRGLPIVSYADVFAFGLPFGIFIGRIGCFLIHDHPGIETTFWLGIQYPDVIIRHDLGFYELLFAFTVSILFLFLLRFKKFVGMYLLMFIVLYGIFRLFLDSLRLLDVIYMGLTPAQYFSVFLLVAGVIFYWKINKINAKKQN